MSASSLVFPGPDGHLNYVPDAQGNTVPDFSDVGYESGIVPLPGTNGMPDVPVKVIVKPLANGVDAGAAIQAAIDQVSKLPVAANGFRGTVLLKAGLYPIRGRIRITTSGVVLRGEGTDVTGTGLTGTVLEATGTNRRYDPHLPFEDGVVQLEGAVPGGANWNGGDDFAQFAVAGTTHNITDNYVPVGARGFHVDSVAGLQVGDSVIVHRPSTAAWIHAIGMDGPTDPWKPGQEDMDSDRVITAIDPVHKLIIVRLFGIRLLLVHQEQHNRLHTISGIRVGGRMHNAPMMLGRDWPTTVGRHQTSLNAVEDEESRRRPAYPGTDVEVTNRGRGRRVPCG
jgi:hypothetical protein